MIRFAHPWILGLWLLVPLLTWVRYGRRFRHALRFSDGHTLAGLPTSWAVKAARLLPLLYLLGLAALILALARPQRGFSSRRHHTEIVDLVLLVDISTSMLAEDMGTRLQRRNRVDAALDTLESFVRKRTGDRIAAIAFAGVPYTMAPLTLDHEWLLQRARQMRAGMVRDGTAIGDALAAGVNRLRASEAEGKVIILLTDGVNNTGTLTPLQAADLAAALDIRVHTIGFGSRGLAPVPVRDRFTGRTRYVQQQADIDEETLRRISARTGGMMFRAERDVDLSAIYEQIDALERTEVEIEHRVRYEERFLPAAMGALLLLLMERLLAAGRLGRIP